MLIKLLLLVGEAEVEAVEEDVLEDVLGKDVVCKAVSLQVGLLEVVLLKADVVKVVVIQVAKLELVLVQALVLEVAFAQANALEGLALKADVVEDVVLKVLVLLFLSKLQGLSQATAKLKLIKVEAGKHKVMQQAGGKAP